MQEFFTTPEVDPEIETNEDYADQLSRTVEGILEGEPELVQAEIKKMIDAKIAKDKNKTIKDATKEAEEELAPEIEKQIIFLQRQIDKQGGKLAVENAGKITKLKEALEVDMMTGLLNSSGFEKRSVQEIINYERYGKDNAEITLIMVDISNFKLINDQDGHQEGDRIIKELANIFKEVVRESDFVGHYGGDEFTIGITHSSSDPKEIRAFLERIQEKIKSNLKKKDGTTIEVSLGAFSTADINDEDWDILNEADLKETKERPSKKAKGIYDHIFRAADETMEMVKILDDSNMNNVAVFDDVKDIDKTTEDFFILKGLRHKKRDLNDILAKPKLKNENEKTHRERLRKEYKKEREKIIKLAKEEFARQ